MHSFTNIIPFHSRKSGSEMMHLYIYIIVLPFRGRDNFLKALGVE